MALRMRGPAGCIPQGHEAMCNTAEAAKITTGHSLTRDKCWPEYIVNKLSRYRDYPILCAALGHSYHVKIATFTSAVNTYVMWRTTPIASVSICHLSDCSNFGARAR